MVNEKSAILRLLIENQGTEYSIRQISQIRKINYKSAYYNIKKLEKERIITVKKQGNISLCSFNGKFNESVYRVEHLRRDILLKNKNFRVLYNRISKINKQFILILFGSHVKGKKNRHSDIDLLLISDDPKKIQNELDLIPLNIHLTHMNYEDFMSMLKSKELTVVSEAIKKNIILLGIEDFYRLIENAR